MSIELKKRLVQEGHEEDDQSKTVCQVHVVHPWFYRLCDTCFNRFDVQRMAPARFHDGELSEDAILRAFGPSLTPILNVNYFQDAALWIQNGMPSPLHPVGPRGVAGSDMGPMGSPGVVGLQGTNRHRVGRTGS